MSGNVDVDIFDGNNLLDSISFSIGKGNNFFGVLSSADMTFTRVSFSSDIDLERLAQIRVGFGGGSEPPGPQPIPEPSAILGWLAVGLMTGACLFYQRRRFIRPTRF